MFLWLQVIDYNGKRDLETFVKFLDNGGVLPEEEEDDEVEEEDEDEDQESKDEVSYVVHVILGEVDEWYNVRYLNTL